MLFPTELLWFHNILNTARWIYSTSDKTPEFGLLCFFIGYVILFRKLIFDKTQINLTNITQNQLHVHQTFEFTLSDVYMKNVRWESKPVHKVNRYIKGCSNITSSQIWGYCHKGMTMWSCKEISTKQLPALAQTDIKFIFFLLLGCLLFSAVFF